MSLLRIPPRRWRRQRRRYLVQDLGTSSSIRYSSHASRGCLPLHSAQPGTVFPLVIRIRDFRRQRTKEDGKGITERETFPENPITRHNFCDICIWIVPRLRKFAAPCFFFFFLFLCFFSAVLLEGNQSFCQIWSIRLSMQTEDLEYLALRFFYGFFPVLFHQTTKSLNIEYSLFSDIYILNRGT